MDAQGPVFSEVLSVIWSMETGDKIYIRSVARKPIVLLLSPDVICKPWHGLETYVHVDVVGTLSLFMCCDDW